MGLAHKRGDYDGGQSPPTSPTACAARLVGTEQSESTLLRKGGRNDNESGNACVDNSAVGGGIIGLIHFVRNDQKAVSPFGSTALI